ncbi:hypothetical protein CMV30_09455 [Nibricoccus aquaticus]|uniref:Cytochrome c domain-containing protein n=1 Tax=Nibricoccus aquaticus TaxID=2576891 RepID=A0A290Q6W4_9BACT|nr:cbb3-type cytochrome c oxidase subunit II [Nibricoccus aquaticus]ATC64163.1 hypothetical protein CMV30_09455 [Nibricoccus aquaticus]
MKTLAPDSSSASPAPAARWPVFLASVAAIAATYTYFLIFAEFAFLEFAAASLNAEQMKPLMTALGLGGIVGSLFAAARFSLARIRPHLALGFLASALVALLTLASRSPATLIASAALIGLFLGWATVTLALSLLPLLGTRALAPACGLGTGLAYALCNQPALFTAPPATQILTSSFAALTGLVATIWLRSSTPSFSTESLSSTTATLRHSDATRWITAFFALVFLDSLAFYLIQHNPAFKTATWSSSFTLQTNALVHLAAAVLAGFALRRFRPAPVVLAALALLVTACALLNSPAPPFALARTLYVAGVSIYSTALVVIPARAARPWFAAAFMAIAGWIGSGAAIGLAQHQTSPHVPAWTLLLALLIALTALARPLFSTTNSSASSVRTPRTSPPAASNFTVLLLAFATVSIFWAPPAHADTADPLVAAGRRVYIAEGCIHCHSQYIRPGTPDVLLWGPAHPLSEVLADSPPLLGNRRQGPDLANVANRRSPDWNRLHLLAPRTVSPGSRMPSYAHLFADGDPRGEALLAYLAYLGADTLPDRLETIARWQPSASPPPSASPTHTQKLFQQLCAACHGPTGRADGPLSSQLSIRPPDFTAPTWRRFPATPDDATLARLIKFGLPGSPMAGHETLPDPDILSLAAYVKSLHAPPAAP